MTNLLTKRSDDSLNRPCRATESGSVLVFIIIVIAVIAAGLFFLNSMRNNAKAEGESFAREIIEKCAFQHDVNWLHGKVASDRRVTVPPAMDDQFIGYLTKLGVPDRNYVLDGKLEFENYFISPHGSYKAILTYPAQHATVNFTISRPSVLWLITDFGVTYERPPE